MSDFIIRQPQIEHLPASEEGDVFQFDGCYRATIKASPGGSLSEPGTNHAFEILIKGARPHDTYESLAKLADEQTAAALEAIAAALRKRAAG